MGEKKFLWDALLTINADYCVYFEGKWHADGILYIEFTKFVLSMMLR